MDLGSHRASLFQHALSPAASITKVDDDAVETELEKGLTVSSATDTDKANTASDKAFASDTRTGIPPQGSAESEEVRIIKERVRDDESGDMVYRLRTEPEGEVIFEVPTETVRKIRVFIDQLLNIQEAGFLDQKPDTAQSETPPEVIKAATPAETSSIEETRAEVRAVAEQRANLES
ncbi:hypothetical protein E1162_18640 [Rhodobacteraceae bacterium RKSG542]|uniref:hypothetical protein n=1 Tax=Pseudovibrio flavus TaxID=2529854 RepID=UPI0012BBE32C|nr:hypothetical protein [Pseudovibrio flavus]MTI19264.1 hypothetical protein [Pseudovibrio flavus]